MKSPRLFLKTILAGVMLLALVSPSSLFACAACFGKSDSPLAQGMNWGILTLMGVILSVLSCFVLFFVHIIRREDAATKNPAEKNPSNE